MTASYAWAMRRGSQILFALSLALFLIGFGQALLALRNTVGDTMIAGEPVSATVTSFLMFLTGTFTAFSSAVLPFIGAVLIDRWDKRTGA